MCGITGVYEYATTEGHIRDEVLTSMRDVLRHRGPDGEGLWISDDRRVGFGHRRLAIIDPHNGHQPMHGPSGACLNFNGEIYNYPRLRAELEAQGVRFATDCDTEVILHLFERDGHDAFQQLEGMFAFALWDARRQRLFLTRDPVGEKPLYWWASAGRLVFGSEIKALLEHPAVDAEVEQSAISPYLANLVTTSPATLFRGISKLPPGSLLACDSDGPTVMRYRDLYSSRRWRDDPGPSVAPRVRELLARSTHDRLMSDVPLGVLLSGGLDSTTLVALLDERARDMATFSVGFAGRPEIDEREEARRVAREFGTDHHETVISEDDAISFLPELVHHQDEPLADPVCVPLHFVCKQAHQTGIKVVLAGEGSDELFWGYEGYRRVMKIWPLMRASLAMPRWARSLLPHLPGAARRPYLEDLLGGVASGRPWPMHYPLGLSSAQRRQLTGSDDPGWIPTRDGDQPPLEQLAFDTQEYEFRLRLPELLLMRIDRFSMANSVEARVPFLAPDLIDYVYRLPLSQKLARGTTKIALREAVGDIVPDWVLNRPKRGFGAPIFEWMESRAGVLLAELMRDPEMRRYFNTQAVTRLLAPGTASRRAFSLWPILNFALWHRKWIEGRALEDTIASTLASGS